MPCYVGEQTSNQMHNHLMMQGNTECNVVLRSQAIHMDQMPILQRDQRLLKSLDMPIYARTNSKHFCAFASFHHVY